MSLLETIFKEMLGRKLTARERREAERELDDLAKQFAGGHFAELPPMYIRATNGLFGEFVFQWQGFRVPRPGEFYLHDGALRDRATRARRHVYAQTTVRASQAGPAPRQEPPPGPARPSRATQIHEALESLGIRQAARAVWPPPASEIRATFIALSKQFHPDVNPGNAEAEARYKEVTAAYTLLKGEGIA